MSTYLTAEFAEQVGISKTSVNYYINILEATGYQVSRNPRNHREYTERDVEIVRSLIALNKERGIRLKDAAQLVIAPDFDSNNIAESFMAPRIQQQVIMPQNKYDEISRSMELLTVHVSGIEQQNEQLIQLIQAQREQNELLMEQNNTLKQELGTMMNHLLEKANAPAEQANKQMNRIEQQNSAIMSVLNRIDVEKATPAMLEQKPEKEKGLLSRFLK